MVGGRLKRALDVVVSAVGLVVLSPVLLVVALLVRSRLGSPVLFHQERVGRGERPFMLHKFRSMTDARTSDGELLPDEKRLTDFGRKLRASSLDELPELWNVFVGEMSLVGPRPLPTRYLKRYRPEERRRHDVRPGITGWAQVNGRNEVGWDERLAMDVWYVENQSLWLDLRVLATTLRTVVWRDGVSQIGEATMSELPVGRR